MTQDNFMNSDGLLYLVQRLNTILLAKLGTKVDTKEGFSLISDTEITRLAQVTNYNDTEIKASLSELQRKVEALEQGTYDDTELRNLIADCRTDIDNLKAKVDNWDAAYTHSQSAHAPSDAQVNVIESIKVNGTAVPVTNKEVDITIVTEIPDEYVTDSELTAKGYAVASNVYSKTEIDNKIKGGVHIKGNVPTYADLPAEPSEGDMYNIIAADTANNIKAGDNVVWNGTNWDQYSGLVDTSGLVAKADAMTNEEIEEIITQVMG